MIGNTLISIVIPVYNVEKYINDCLESVLRQTYKNIEIILVDDASLDDSGKKCDIWAKKDKRIKVVHKQKNEGLNMARATGFEHSKGEWISFVDSDDVIAQNYVEDLFKTALSAGVDISVGRNRRFVEKKQIPLKEKCDDDVMVIKEKLDIMRYVFVESPDSEVYMVVAWGKLFKRYVIEEIDWRLADARANEDELEAMQYYDIQKQGVAILKKTLYYYRYNPDSITSKPYLNKHEEKPLSRFEWLEKLYNISTEYFGDARYADELLYHNIMLNLLFLNKDLSEGFFNHDNYQVFCQNFYPKMDRYEKISHKYPLRFEERRAYDLMRVGDIFTIWTDDRKIINNLRQSIEGTQKDNYALQRVNDDLKQSNAALRQELDEIKASRLWKLRNIYRAYVNKK